MDQSPNISLEIKCLELEKEILIEKIKKHYYSADIMKELIDYNRNSFGKLKKNATLQDMEELNYYTFFPFKFNVDNISDEIYFDFSIEDLESIKLSKKVNPFKSTIQNDVRLLRGTIRMILWRMNSKGKAIQLSLSKLEQEIKSVDEKIEHLKNYTSHIEDVPKLVSSETPLIPNPQEPKLIQEKTAKFDKTLKELCDEIAKGFGLVKGVQLSGVNAKKVYNAVIALGRQTTEDSVTSTLRYRLGYKKRTH